MSFVDSHVSSNELDNDAERNAPFRQLDFTADSDIYPLPKRENDILAKSGGEVGKFCFDNLPNNLDIQLTAGQRTDPKLGDPRNAPARSIFRFLSHDLEPQLVGEDFASLLLSPR